MRLPIIAICLIAVLAVFAFGVIEPPTTVTQYQTAAGWRLYMPFYTHHFWPMSDFRYWEIIISRHRIGIHPPYIGSYAFLSEQNYPDPEIELLAPLAAGEEFYCRARIVNNLGVVDESAEFTFCVGEAEPLVYSDVVPWVATDMGWETSIVVSNTGASAIEITVDYRYQTGAATGIVDVFPLEPYATRAFYVPPGLLGIAIVTATGPAKWQSIAYLGEFVVNGSGALVQ